MNNSEIGPGLVNYDFVRFFPHKSWVSNWAKDDVYPDGFCYKILSVRDEADNKVELILVRSFWDGTKEELHRTRVHASDVESAVSIFVGGLVEKFKLNFEEQIYTSARSLREFSALTEKYGWTMRIPEAQS